MPSEMEQDDVYYDGSEYIETVSSCGINLTQDMLEIFDFRPQGTK